MVVSNCFYSESRPNGPTLTSEYEHCSIPATIKKIFNLSSDFLTQRDAWAGTFDSVYSELTSPRTDCPELLPVVPPPRVTELNENRRISEFQSEIVQLAAALNGVIEGMSVKEADAHVNHAIARFFKASKETIRKGADENEIVDLATNGR
ncbi:hypothetical protein ZIOFF_027785 [Zingiber officinale]|uniref:Uncharacterized protein n=1 Tax=Zingiber officinale TaxID=94328 RepID=A0A8J5GLY4_ZINOF|nr:hypothetical protein ZIOFF_027785 [Zingiber officinale]